MTISKQEVRERTSIEAGLNVKTVSQANKANIEN